MNKFLNIFRIILLIILIILNICCVIFKTNLVGLSHIFYLLFLCIILLVTARDIIVKKEINNNKTYHIVSILIFLIMNIVLFRTIFDSHLFFNNTNLINEYEKYSEIVGSYAGNFSNYAKWYLKQNMIYFNILFILMFIYRNFNLKEK